MTGGVLLVGLLGGDLSPHLCEEHAHAWCVLDEVLELLQDGDEFLGVVVDMVDLLLEPFPLDPGVG